MCDDCEWADWLERMDDADAHGMRFGSDTIMDIHDWVEENEHITEAQQTAVNNILEKQGL